MTVDDVMALILEHYPLLSEDQRQEPYLRHAAEVIHKQGMKTGLTPFQVIDLYMAIEKAFMLTAWA